MTALKSSKPNNIDNALYSEISLSSAILGARRVFLYEFLISCGISSLSEVTPETLRAFVYAVRQKFAFSPDQYSAYKGDLEVVLFAYMKLTRHPLTSLTHYADNPIGRKCLTYLYTHGLTSLEDITADTRRSYDEYLALSVPRKRTEYIKKLDLMVLSVIENITFIRKPVYDERLFYIGYYPDIYIAKRLINTARKEFLYFDFSLPAAALVKRQIFQILLTDLSRIKEFKNHHLLQHYITPLHYLYDFCVENGITDLKQLTDKEVTAFNIYLDKNLDAVIKCAPQVIYRARRFLFLNDQKPDFTATCWFLSKFNLSGRLNPATPIETFYFGDISADNRTVFQKFMKYLLTLSPRYSIQTLLTKYYNAKDFIYYLERRHSSLCELSYADIEEYINRVEKHDLVPHTYNTVLTTLSSFLTTLAVREQLLIPSFPFEYYYKKDFYLHHDRSVPEGDVDRIFTVLSDFPETLGLMYLTLYSTGIRINEVCTLKKEAIIKSNGTHWLKIYQYKLRSDKEIPIPDELYRLLIRHISEDGTGSEYIFHSCMDASRPYRAQTFSKQMKAQLKLYDETCGIRFRSHDYRHTIATDLHTSGAPIAATRAFMGHDNEDMTKHYIDHLPGHIDMLQDEYFKENKLK